MNEQFPPTDSPEAMTPHEAAVVADRANQHERALRSAYSDAINTGDRELQNEIANQAAAAIQVAGTFRMSAWTRDPSLAPQGWKPKPE